MNRAVSNNKRKETSPGSGFPLGMPLDDRSLRQLQRLERQTSGELLRAGLFGLEREALRVTADGRLAMTPHPAAFGAKLGNPRITVDFSESQLEMITSPEPSVEQALQALVAIRRDAEDVLADVGERLWPFSMPPALPADEEIPIARFDDTAEGRQRELYRVGLANRYGRRMQMISGVHLSFSFHEALLGVLGQADGGRTAGKAGSREFADAAYFRTARNFLRNRWLLVYLTGASPAVDATFNPALERQLKTIRACCPGCCDFVDDYQRFATSLRVSRFGYADTAFRRMPVSFNRRVEYVRDLRALLQTRSERFARLGLRRGGQAVQLNDRVLQRDSEFYAAIRLKGRIHPGDSHLDAIERNGVHYAEVRILDINPFAIGSVDETALRFLQVLLLDALLAGDEPLWATEWERLQENHQRVALSGRRPGLRLRTADGEVPMRLVAATILTRLRLLAELMDRGLDQPRFGAAVEDAWESLDDPSRLPSSRMQRAMERGRLSHAAYGAWLLEEAARPVALERIYLAS